MAQKCPNFYLKAQMCPCQVFVSLGRYNSKFKQAFDCSQEWPGDMTPSQLKTAHLIQVVAHFHIFTTHVNFALVNAKCTNTLFFVKVSPCIDMGLNRHTMNSYAQDAGLLPRPHDNRLGRRGLHLFLSIIAKNIGWIEFQKTTRLSTHSR